eukprot:TRINITY_DN17531_c0_g1_i1.p1 TRINITY_DN17531_c0_g1~~TRINITY_DN17531_c0_g1_i1.p1  ORF type:complete len:934 (-),score=255.29 TRINITY_DN17531_c0_g1_i1:88-2889(-)
MAADGGQPPLSAALRMLSEAAAVQESLTGPAGCEEENGFMQYTGATELAQVISGVAFIGLSMWLIFGNTAKLATAQKASLEQRLTMAATINTAVCLFSGFFNILQLTSIDDFVLPRSTTFVLDLSRPVEWVLTCPIMQLSLVLLGGNRIPPYRRFMMPLLSVSVLLCGTASMFTAGMLRFAWYGFGLTLAFIMFAHNAIQIVENSEGTECLRSGASDFRRLSILLIATWFPFPCWFLCSPEGLGLVTDALVIHMGWVVLNIVSKFSFIVYMQRIKVTYIGKLEATRELYEAGSQERIDAMKEFGAPMRVEPAKLGFPPSKEFKEAIPSGAATPATSVKSGVGYARYSAKGFTPEKDLRILVEETMAALCMRDHSERFLAVLLAAGVNKIPKLEALTEEECMDLQVPWNLVDAAIKRYKVERLEKADIMVDLPQAVTAAFSLEPEPLPPLPSCDPQVIEIANRNSMLAIKMQEASNQTIDARLTKIEEVLGSILHNQVTSQDTSAAVLRQTESYQALIDGLSARIEAQEKLRRSEVECICLTVGDKVDAVQAAATQQIKDATAEQAKEVAGRISHEVQVQVDKAHFMLADRILQKIEHQDQAIKEVMTSTASVLPTLMPNVSALQSELQSIFPSLQATEKSILGAVQQVESKEDSNTERVVSTLTQQFASLEQQMDLDAHFKPQMEALKGFEHMMEQRLTRLQAATDMVPTKVDGVADNLLRIERKTDGLELKLDDSLEKEALLLTKVERTEASLKSKLEATDGTQANLLSHSDQQIAILRESQDMIKQNEKRVDDKIQGIQEQVKVYCQGIPQNVAETVKKFIQSSVARQEDSMSDIRRMNMMVMDTLSGVQVRSQESADILKTFQRSESAVLDSSGMGSGKMGEFDKQWQRISSPGAAGLGSIQMDAAGANEQANYLPGSGTGMDNSTPWMS